MWKGIARTAVVIFGTMLIGGCATAGSAPAYSHPQKTAEQQRQDESDCRFKTQQIEQAKRIQGFSRLDMEDYYDDCMREKGYTPGSP